MKLFLTLILLYNFSFAVVDSAYITEPPYTDPSSNGYTHEYEAPFYDFEVLDANSCLCGGEDLTYNVYYINIDEDNNGYPYVGSGGQALYSNNYVNFLPCVDMNSLTLTWKQYDYDNNDDYVDTGGFITATYTVWGLSESDTVSTSLCQSEDWSEIIKHLDKVEYNQQSKLLKYQKYNTKNEDINKKLFDIKSKIAVSNNELKSINDLVGLTQLNDINLNKTNDNSLLDEILNKLTQNFNLTSDMNSNAVNKQSIENSLNALSIQDYTNDDTSTYNDFTNIFQTDITNSYNTYLSSLGIGGYATAPNPIIINLYGNTYKFLDVSTFENEVPLLRASFLSFGYLWGFILAFRGV